jgi:hypothetical protein
MAVATMAATDAFLGGGPPVTGRAGGRRAATGVDRVTVWLFSLTAFLLVLALLATQLPADTDHAKRPIVVLRKVYETTVVETVAGGRGAATAPSVTQSVSSSGSSQSVAAAPTTRSS